MTCARRQAGARRPAPSTSAEPVPSSSRGSRRPDARTGRAGTCRARTRRLTLLLPVLALLLGALGLFASGFAQAQATAAVSNQAKTKYDVTVKFQ